MQDIVICALLLVHILSMAQTRMFNTKGYFFFYNYFQVATVLDWVRDLVGADHYNMENCGVTVINLILLLFTITNMFTSNLTL